MRIARLPAAVALAATLIATLAGCSATVPLEPAADANDPGCADVIVRLPDTLADQPRRETNAQATGAWGSPTTVQLYCGVEVPSASTQRCVAVDDIFWLVDDSAAPIYTFRLYGREPAIDVVLDNEEVGSFPVLSGLGRAVSFTTPNGHECLDVDDATPAPDPGTDGTDG